MKEWILPSQQQLQSIWNFRIIILRWFPAGNYFWVQFAEKVFIFSSEKKSCSSEKRTFLKLIVYGR